MRDKEATDREMRWIPGSIGAYEEMTRNEEIIYYDRYDDLLDLVVVRARFRPGDYVLDIGTGLGELARRIVSRRNVRLVGIDPSEAMIEGARERAVEFGDRITFKRVDNPFLAIPFGDEQFNVVVSTFAFHHVRDEDKARAIAEAARPLVPGGRIVLGDVFFPDKAALRDAMDRWSELEEEYFGLLDMMYHHFADAGLTFEAERVGEISWVVIGQKISM